MADGLKEVYQAVTVEEAERQLAQFEEAWAGSYPVIAGSWRQSGHHRRSPLNFAAQ